MSQQESSDIKPSLPAVAWDNYERVLKSVAEGEAVKLANWQSGFLESLNFLRKKGDQWELSELGRKYYEEKYISSSQTGTTAALKEALLGFPPAEAIVQLLHGVSKPTPANALSILKSRGYWRAENKQTFLVHFLLVMNKAGLLVYSKKVGSLRILHNPNVESEVPQNIFIEPTTPYSNLIWLKRVLASAEGFIYWIDKHFTKEALELLWEIADANKIKEIKILSLGLEAHLTSTARKEYLRLKTELKAKGIELTWYVIDSKLIRDTHDRWILSKKEGFNLPDTNTILSGSRSEISSTSNFEKMVPVFQSYIPQATEVV